jgi:hypothetical protein
MKTIAAMNRTPEGPRCPANWEMSGGDNSEPAAAWLTSETTLSCQDPGDGTALRQAWVTAIDGELSRLGALVISDGAGVTHYRLGLNRGQVWLSVLPAPAGRYWVVVRFVEAS